MLLAPVSTLLLPIEPASSLQFYASAAREQGPAATLQLVFPELVELAMQLLLHRLCNQFEGERWVGSSWRQQNRPFTAVE